MRALKRILLFIATVYIGVCAVMYLIQRELIYKPSEEPVTIAALPFENISAVKIDTYDNIRITGYMIKTGTESAPLMVFFPGNSGSLINRVQKIQNMLALGYDVFYIGYRGYLGNPGSPSEDYLTRDSETWLAWLIGLSSLSKKDLVLYGESLGTGIALKMAKKFPAKAIILEAPYSSIADVAKNKYFYLPVDLLLKDRFDSITTIKSVSTPLVIVHGTNDQIINLDLGKKLYDNADDPKLFLEIKGAGHNNLYDYHFLERADMFVKEHLSSGVGNENF